MEYDYLLVFWNKALEAVKTLKEHLSSITGGWDLDNNSIPKSIISQLDSFQYEVCKKFSISNEFNHYVLHVPMYKPMNYEILVKTYNEKYEEYEELNEKQEILKTERVIFSLRKFLFVI